MKRSVAAGVALALALSASPLLAARKHFSSVLTTQTNGSGATGTGKFTYDDTTKVLCGKVTYADLSGGALTTAALKSAVDNSLVKAVAPVSASPMTVTVTLDQAQADLLNLVPPPGLYIALGNAMNPVSNNAADNGELNGELNPDLAGTDQCPPVADAGTDSGADAGKDAGGTDAGKTDSGTTSSSGGSSSGGSSSGGSSSGATSSSGGSSSGDTTSSSSSSSGDVDAGGTGGALAPATKDDGGCSTSGTASSGGALLAGLVAIMLASRGRRRTK